MEDVKKRKLGEAAGNVEASSEEELRLLLDPLPKPQLVHLLSKLGSQYPSIAEEIRSIASADPVHRKLFVRGLAWNTTSETLCAAFIMHGEIEEGAVIYDKATGKSRGYGFITYKHMESAQNALSAASKMIDGRLAVCNLACEGLSGASTTHDLAQRKLYIGGLSPEITSEKLLSFFGKHGEIEEGSVAYDKDTNESRGFGFVTFKTVDAAKKAIDDPNKMLGLTAEEVDIVTKLAMVGERLYAWKNMVLAEREIVFQGRNIIVKLADTHKGKSLQTQLPTVAGPMTLPMAAGYPQPGSAHVNTTAPIGYTYPQPVAPYSQTSFSSPPTAAAPYPIQPPISYAPVTLKKEPLGLPAAPAGIGAYPYYISK